MQSRPSNPEYAELWTTSCFSFLEGASTPEELVHTAAALGHRAIGCCDRASLAGAPRFHAAATTIGLPLAIGARIDARARLAFDGSSGFDGLAARDPGRRGASSRGLGSDGTGSHGAATNGIGAAPPTEPEPPPLLLYATDRASYGRLCRLITRGRRRAPKGSCHLELADVLELSDGLLAIALPPEPDDPRGPARTFDAFARGLELLRAAFGVGTNGRLSVGLTAHLSGDDDAHLARVRAVAHRLELSCAAVGDARMARAERHALLDVLTCIRAGCTIDAAGHRLASNAERRLHAPAVIARRLAGHEDALERSVELALRAAAFSLDELDFRYPDEVATPGRTAMEELVVRTREGARERYPEGVPAAVERLVEREFALIDELGYAPYFLTVWDLVRFARSRSILCQGRGAAANSAVCYCLGVTAVDPARSQLLFERFVSKERGEPPDIDVDFEHERREEVIQYLYRRHGRDHAALTAAFTSYRGRGALRDAGKVLGLALETVDTLAKGFDHWGELDDPERRIRDLGFDPSEPTLRWLVRLAGELQGLPRHMSQHTGGFVITRNPLCELVPIANAAMEDRTTIEWDKDDLDALGILKVDVLALGMLTCVRRCFDLVREAQEESLTEHEPRAQDANANDALVDGAVDGSFAGAADDAADAGVDDEVAVRPASARAPDYDRPRDLTLSTIPPEDPDVYAMMQRADTVGVFQIESRAQMSMLPRLKPSCFYDLVIEVAIVRPGPIQGRMVHPYLRRRAGEEPVDYPSDEVKGVLERTLGVPIFQEQAMALSVVAAGFTPSEADQLRRAMGSWRKDGRALERLGAKLVEGLLARGYSDDFSERLLEQIHGFGDYGFPESHAASFALIVYVSAWLKHRHPAAFAAALINSQPMGFYAPAQIVRDAREHGVEVRPVDANASDWDCTLERVESGGATASRDGAGSDGAGSDGAGRDGAPSCGSSRAHEAGTRADAPRPGGLALRLGMRQVKGVAEEDARRIAGVVRLFGPFDSIETLWRMSGASVGALRRLARADAFASFGVTRERALWEVRALHPGDVTGTVPDPPATGADRRAVRDGRRRWPGGLAPYRSRSARAASLDAQSLDAELLDASTPGASSLGPRRIRTPRIETPALPFEAAASEAELPRADPLRAVLADYSAAGLSLRGHPLAFLRPELDALGAIRARDLADADALPHGRRVRVCGLVLVRQRPGTANGIVFVTLEDETGVANLIVRPRIFERDRRAARHAVCLLASGRVERQGAVVHVLVTKLDGADARFTALRSRSRDFS